MVKLIKITAYLVDFDDAGAEETKTLLDQCSKYLHFFRIQAQEEEIGEWEDENPLNDNDTDIKEFEKFFELKQEKYEDIPYGDPTKYMEIYCEVDGEERIMHARTMNHPEAREWIEIAKRNKFIHFRIKDIEPKKEDKL